jgi:hypothetical protein
VDATAKLLKEKELRYRVKTPMMNLELHIEPTAKPLKPDWPFRIL